MTVKRKKFIYFVIVLLAILFQGSAQAYDIRISDAWVRMVPSVIKTTAAYLTLHNDSVVDAEILLISSPQFAMVQAHESRVKDGMVQMIGAGKLLIPAKGKLEFVSEGRHLMLMSRKLELQIGTKITLDFQFTDGSHYRLVTQVKK